MASSKPEAKPGERVWHGATQRDMERLIASLAWKIVRKYALDPHQHLDDLIQEGWESACNAYMRYEPRGHKFTSYCYVWILGSMHHYAKKESGILRSSDGDDELFDVPDLRTASVDQLDEILDAVTGVQDGELVLARAMGFTDAEIAAMKGQDEIQVRRISASRGMRKNRTQVVD